MGNFITSRNVSRGFPPQLRIDTIDGAYTGRTDNFVNNVHDDSHFLYPLRRKTVEEFEDDLKDDMVWGIYADRPALLDHRKNRRAAFLQTFARRAGLPEPQNEDLAFYHQKVLNDRHNFTIQPVLPTGVCRNCNLQNNLEHCPTMRFLQGVDNIGDLVKLDQAVNATLPGIVHSGAYVTFQDFLQECRAADQIYLLNVVSYTVSSGTPNEREIQDGFIALQRWSSKTDMNGKTYLYIYRRSQYHGCSVYRTNGTHDKVKHATVLKY